MNKWIGGAIGWMVVMRVMAGPELSGTPGELAAHLRSLPGQVTLSADTEIKVEADRAEVVLKLRTVDRSLKAALVLNQEMRADLVTTLEKHGIPADRIRMSRFSTTPTQGYFTSKVKAYEVESRVTIEATSEKELQAIAWPVDEKEGITLLSLTFKDSRKESHTAQVLAEALAKLNRLKALHEKELGVTLVAREFTSQPVFPSIPPARPRSSARKEVSGESSKWAGPDAPMAVSALDPGEVDLSQFDQVRYGARVTVTYEVNPPPATAR